MASCAAFHPCRPLVGRVILNAPPVRSQSVPSPCAIRQKPVARPWIARRARTPHEPTQDERHTGRDRTTNERITNN